MTVVPSPVLPVSPLLPVDPVAPVLPVAPVSPVEPAGPAGPGTATTVAGVTTVGLSHALNANAIAAAVNTIEYFMGIPLSVVGKPLVQKGRWLPLLIQADSSPYMVSPQFVSAHTRTNISVSLFLFPEFF